MLLEIAFYVLFTMIIAGFFVGFPLLFSWLMKRK